MSDKLLSKVQGCLLGVMIGDAMGMPWETMTPEQILEATGGKGVIGFHDPVQRKIPDTMCKKAGDATDDWQLTAVVAESLIRCKGFNLVDIAHAHIEAREQDEFGWGGTTRRSIDEVKKYFDSRGKSGRAPWISPPKRKKGGCGNGVAMKSAPLALWNAVISNNNVHDVGKNFELLKNQIIELGLMTHFDQRASTAAFAVVRFIGCAIFGGANKGEVSAWTTCPWIEDFENDLKRMGYDADYELTVSGQIKYIFNFLDDPIALREKIGTGCFSLESVPFAIATFLRHPTDFRAGILEAVNAGGDMDTTASMVGAMIGANCGLDAIPDEWKNFRPEFQEPLELGERLYKAALGL